MKHIIRDFLIQLIAFSGLAWWYRRVVRRRGPLVRILAFHDVADAVWFERLLVDILKRYHVITPLELEGRRFVSDRINVVLSFDDGYESWLSVVAPILERHNLKGVFFVNSGLLAVAHDDKAVAAYMQDRLLLTPKQALSWEGAAKLQKQGHVIGGHTITHPRLATLAEMSLTEEIATDRQTITAKLQQAPRHFAYPFGRLADFSDVARTVAKRAEYTHLYTAESGFFTGDIKNIPRTLVEKGQSAASLRRWIGGSYDIFTRIIAFVK